MSHVPQPRPRVEDDKEDFNNPEDSDGWAPESTEGVFDRRRAYQACIPCRQRKVRCIPGSVDNPHDPPCLSCKRAARECSFSSTRRKRVNRDHVSKERSHDHGHELNTGDKSLRANTLDIEDKDDDDFPRTEGRSTRRTRLFRKSEELKTSQHGEGHINHSDQRAATLQASDVNSGHDALEIPGEATVSDDRLDTFDSTQWPSVNEPPYALPSFLSMASPAATSNVQHPQQNATNSTVTAEAPDDSFRFFVATNPSQLLDNAEMRAKRKRVMQDYLRKERSKQTPYQADPHLPIAGFSHYRAELVQHNKADDDVSPRRPLQEHKSVYHSWKLGITRRHRNDYEVFSLQSNEGSTDAVFGSEASPSRHGKLDRIREGCQEEIHGGNASKIQEERSQRELQLELDFTGSLFDLATSADRDEEKQSSIGVERHVDVLTAADSGYHSGAPTSCTNVVDGSVINNDTDSVVTDSWPSSLPKQDKYLLEVEFARELFNRSNARTRAQFAERGKIVLDLLYSFSVMIGGRATSVAERGAASFVRRGRNRILKHVREELIPEDTSEMRTSTDDMSVTEKMVRWDVNTATERSDPELAQQCWPRKDYDEYSNDKDKEKEKDIKREEDKDKDHHQDNNRADKNEEDRYEGENREDDNDEGHIDDDDFDGDDFDDDEGVKNGEASRPTVLLGYTDLRAFLLESEEYRWLLRQLELVNEYENEGNTWLHVHRRIIGSLAAQPTRIGTICSMSLCLPWQPRDFMHEQYGKLEVVALLGDVITISGSAENAFASTCEAYVLQTWPEHGRFVLESMERATNSTRPILLDVAADLSLRISIHEDCTTIDIVGNPMFLAEATEILVWLSTACRASATGDWIQTGHMNLEQVPDDGDKLAFVAKLNIEDATGDDGPLHAACWHGMFRNPVIAHGYPIPSRKAQEQGLELSIDLMLTLAQAFHAVVYCGVLMMKGFSSLLEPTRKEENSVTWHFILNKTGVRQTYNDGLEHSCIHRLDDAIFDGARHFVGWSKSVEFLVGSPQAEYGNIGFTGSKQTNPGLSAEAAFTITGGKFVSVNAKFLRGTKDKPESLKTENYVKNVEEAARFKVILSDSDTKQHWLADGCSVILHLARAWLSGKHTRSAPEGIDTNILSAKSVAGPQRSYDTLVSLKNRRLPLYIDKNTCKKSLPFEEIRSIPDESTSEQEWFLFEDQAQYYYHWLEQIRDRMVFARNSPEISLIRQGNNIIGFEFIDLLRESSVRPYTLELSDGARAWQDYAKDWDAIHIIGSDFGDLLRPVPAQGASQGGCGRDLAAPNGQDYLMAPLSVLKEGIERFRHTRECAQLAHDVYWWNTELCFRSCQCHKSRSHRKCQSHVNNLQSNFMKRPQHKPSTRLPDVFREQSSGAIIIGTHLVAKLLPVAGRKRAPPVDTTVDDDQDHSPPGRLLSDSGYVSNVSQESQVVDPRAGTPLAMGYKILGAANKLQKRRK